MRAELKDTVNSNAELTSNDIKLLTFTTNLVDSIAQNLLLLTLDNSSILPESHYRDLLAWEESFDLNFVLIFHTISIRTLNGTLKLKEAQPSSYD